MDRKRLRACAGVRAAGSKFNGVFVDVVVDVVVGVVDMTGGMMKVGQQDTAEAAAAAARDSRLEERKLPRI